MFAEICKQQEDQLMIDDDHQQQQHQQQNSLRLLSLSINVSILPSQSCTVSQGSLFPWMSIPSEFLNSQTHGSIPINPHNHENPNACSQRFSKIQNTRRRGGRRGTTTTTEKQAPQKLQEVQEHKKIQKEQKNNKLHRSCCCCSSKKTGGILILAVFSYYNFSYILLQILSLLHPAAVMESRELACISQKNTRDWNHQHTRLSPMSKSKW